MAYGFQSTLPAGGATIWEREDLLTYTKFQSTLPAGGATPDSYPAPRLHPPISIHAPRGGSDVRNFVCSVLPLLYFNPRSPRGERLDEVLPGDTFEIFQSTLPAGGATSRLKSCEEASDCISIHAPRGGSDLPFRAYCLIWNISIHAPRGGSDGAADGVSVYLHLISIHAPRGGSDQHLLIFCPFPSLDFNPRSPRGERPADRCVYRPD